MTSFAPSLCCLALAGLATTSQAQVVQLPTFRTFSISTTVAVPDRGAAYLGGVTRGSWGSSSRGVPGLSQVPGLNRAFTNRGYASSVSSSHAYATATIIDHAELDRMVLAEAAARRGARSTATVTEHRAAYLSKHVARAPKIIPGNVDKASNRNITTEATLLDAALARQEAELAGYLKRAEQAEMEGRNGSARCCYSVLLRRGSDEHKALAAERLASLAAAESGTKLTTRDH